MSEEHRLIRDQADVFKLQVFGNMLIKNGYKCATKVSSWLVNLTFVVNVMS